MTLGVSQDRGTRVVLTTLNVRDGVEVNTLSALGRVEVITLIMLAVSLLPGIIRVVLTTLNVLDGVEVITLGALGRVEVITLIKQAVSQLPGIISFFRE